MDSNRPVALDPHLGDPGLPVSAGVQLIRSNLPAAISVLNASTSSAAGTGIHPGRALAPNQPARRLHPRCRDTPAQAPRLQPAASPDARGQGRAGGDRRGMRGLHPHALTEPRSLLESGRSRAPIQQPESALCANVAASGVCARPLPNRDQRKAPPGDLIRFLLRPSPSNPRSSDSECVNRRESKHVQAFLASGRH